MPVKGLQLTVTALKRYSKELQEDVKDAVEETTLLIQREAIMKAPAAGDQLKTTYGFQKNSTGINQLIFASFPVSSKGFTGEVSISDTAGNLPVFVELGTGLSAAQYVPTLPKEWQEVARRYYVNGKGTLIKQPFLLPSFFEQAPKLIDKIRTILKNKKL